MRKVFGVAVAAVLCLFMAGPAAGQNYTATIDGGQAVPPRPTPGPGTGMGSMMLDATKMLSFNITFSALSAPEIAAHFHGPVPVGSNAGVQFPLPLGSPKIGTVGPLSPAQESDLNAGLWYINIHSSLYPDGEIRGQVLVVPVANQTDSWSAIKALYAVED